jgi:hypothetical protein
MEKYEISVPETFDFDKKYLLLKERNITYIKLRLCDSKEWGLILSTILNSEIIIINDYETSNKKIKTLYENFKNNYKIPNNLLESIKNDKYLNYYYSSEEKKEYLNNWINNSSKEENVYNNDEYKLYFSITLENRSRFVVQLNHYLDLGCKCNLCNNKRKILKERAKNGEIITERINHNDLVKENLMKIKKIITKKQMDIKENKKSDKRNIGMIIK